jgi:hypothetical protein
MRATHPKREGLCKSVLSLTTNFEVCEFSAEILAELRFFTLAAVFFPGFDRAIGHPGAFGPPGTLRIPNCPRECLPRKSLVQRKKGSNF